MDKPGLYPIFVRQRKSKNRYKTDCMDGRGETVIAPTFDDGVDFSEGLAAVRVRVSGVSSIPPDTSDIWIPITSAKLPCESWQGQIETNSVEIHVVPSRQKRLISSTGNLEARVGFEPLRLVERT